MEEVPIDPAAEKRLLRKLDFMLSPMMVLIFLVAYLDRSNIGECLSFAHACKRAPADKNYRQRSNRRHERGSKSNRQPPQRSRHPLLRNLHRLRSPRLNHAQETAPPH